ncbi:MAG: 50S ribosomal protein L6 [Patescibacteria group bacterium]|nr:50S ribosomal protein L6 [Patescibacteria group bacterium]
MSKIGKKPIEIPSGVTVSIGDNNEVIVKGSKGELKDKFDRKISIEIKDNIIEISPKGDKAKANVLWGLSRTLVANMIEGVQKGFEKKLEIQGVGYKVITKGKDLELSLGFSHLVPFKAPEGIEFNVEKNIITVSGIDKQLVGQVAADIRSKKKPEPYKGKGIRYIGEHIIRKAGKKVAGSKE